MVGDNGVILISRYIISEVESFFIDLETGVMNLIDGNMNRIRELCRQYKVKSLYVFGSILTPRFRADSDVDLLVRFDKEAIPLGEYADNFFDFQFDLEALFSRKVDLVCEDSIRNPFFRDEVNSQKHLIYGSLSV